MAQIDRKYFPALDGLRTLCIFLVILAHIDCTGLLRQVPGWVGVDIFFVISGFLITTLLLREERENQRIDLKAFYVRRFFRIVPLYAILLAFYIVQARMNPERWRLELHSLPYQLTFMNDLLAVQIDKLGLETDPAVFGASWSLGIEEKFYLLWPALFFFLPDRRLRKWVIPVLLIGAAFLPFRMFRSYFGLLVGCCLAILLSGGIVSRTRRLLERIPAGLALLMTFACMALVQYNEAFIFLFSLCAGLLVATLVVREDIVVRFFSSHPMVWLGRRSYSMYLVQAIALNLVERFLKPTNQPKQLAILLLGFGLSALIAAVLYRIVEEPTRIYGKRWLAQTGHVASSNTPIAVSVPKPAIVHSDTSLSGEDSSVSR